MPNKLKPEEKNCGNCGNMGKLIMPNKNGKGPCHIPKPPAGYCTAWIPRQPKPAEAKAKGWEQRFDTFWKSYADKEDVLYTWNNCQRRKDELLSFIRAEIEKAVSKERQSWEAHLPLVPDAENLKRLLKESKQDDHGAES